VKAGFNGLGHLGRAMASRIESRLDWQKRTSQLFTAWIRGGRTGKNKVKLLSVEVSIGGDYREVRVLVRVVLFTPLGDFSSIVRMTLKRRRWTDFGTCGVGYSR
jgi:hypothetical protein